MTGKDMVRLLRENGWAVDRISGSHHIMVKPGKRSCSRTWEEGSSQRTCFGNSQTGGNKTIGGVMYYFAKIVKEEGSYLVSFPDMENIITYGDTLEDALNNAHEALNGVLESDFERGYALPQAAARHGRNMHPVEVAPHIEIAYQLRRLRKEHSQKEIARRLGISAQAYQKLENPRKCNPTIKTLEKISGVLNKKLEVSFV
jgi:antitoxin HicB